MDAKSRRGAMPNNTPPQDIVAHNSARRTLHPARRKRRDGNNTSSAAMGPYNRYSVREQPLSHAQQEHYQPNQPHHHQHQQHDELPQILLKGSLRRKKHLTEKCDLQSLKELDETVASVGKLYASSRRPGPEDDLRSMGSHTMSTQDGHSIYTHRHLIDNMRDMNRSTCQSVASSPSKSSMSRKSKSSHSSRRSRKSSLERLITQTILTAASIDGGSGQFLETVHETSAPVEASSASTDFILKDLYTINTIMASEARSHASGDASTKPAAGPALHSSQRLDRPGSHRFNPLLPPIVSASFASQEDDPLAPATSPTPCALRYEKNDTTMPSQSLGETSKHEGERYVSNVADLDFFASNNAPEPVLHDSREDGYEPDDWPYGDFAHSDNEIYRTTSKGSKKKYTQSPSADSKHNYSQRSNPMWLSSSEEDWSSYQDEKKLDDSYLTVSNDRSQIEQSFSKSSTMSSNTELLIKKIDSLHQGANAEMPPDTQRQEGKEHLALSPFQEHALSQDTQDSPSIWKDRLNEIEQATKGHEESLAFSEWTAPEGASERATQSPEHVHKKEPEEDKATAQNTSNHSAASVDSRQWTNFETNPFTAVAGESDSDESPNSIADFWEADQSPTSVSDFCAVRQWKSSERGWKSPDKSPNVGMI